MTDQLVKEVKFSVSTLAGNCGITTAYRLNGTYISQKYHDREQRERASRKSLVRLPEYHGEMHLYIKNMHRYDSPGVPLSWCFAAVLQRVHIGSYSMLIVTDTDKGTGDGHQGAFSPRHFVDWLVSEGLYQVTNVTADRSGHNYAITTWVLVPYRTKIETMLRDAETVIKDYITTHNSAPALVQQLAMANREGDELHQTISDGWSPGIQAVDDNGADLMNAAYAEAGRMPLELGSPPDESPPVEAEEAVPIAAARPTNTSNEILQEMRLRRRPQTSRLRGTRRS